MVVFALISTRLNHVLTPMADSLTSRSRKNGLSPLGAGAPAVGMPSDTQSTLETIGFVLMMISLVGRLLYPVLCGPRVVYLPVYMPRPPASRALGSVEPSSAGRASGVEPTMGRVEEGRVGCLQ